MERNQVILASSEFYAAYQYAQERGWEDKYWIWRPSGWEQVLEYRLVEA
jgi:hypothetical protein